MSDISYRIEGSDLQYVEVILPPQSSFMAEPGAMMYMDGQLSVASVLGDGSASRYGAIGRLINAIKRSFTGESLFSSRYTNPSARPQRLAFAPPSISKIVGINLADIGGGLICQKGAYLAGADGLAITLAFQKRLRVGLFGGEGFVMQRISGNGSVFICANGSLTEMTLLPGEIIRVDSGCLVALTPSTTYEIKYAGKVKTALFGGEGLFYASISGPGKVWLQSLPEKRLAIELMRAAVTGRTNGVGGKMYLLLIIFLVIFSILAGVE